MQRRKRSLVTTILLQRLLLPLRVQIVMGRAVVLSQAFITLRGRLVQRALEKRVIYKTKTETKSTKIGSLISFTGYGACEHYNSLTKERCKCTGYKGDGAKGPCRNCGQSYYDHYR